MCGLAHHTALPSLGSRNPAAAFPREMEIGVTATGAPKRPGAAGASHADLISHRLTANPRVRRPGAPAASVPGLGRPARRSRTRASSAPALRRQQPPPEPQLARHSDDGARAPGHGRFCVSAARATRLRAAKGKRARGGTGVALGGGRRRGPQPGAPPEPPPLSAEGPRKWGAGVGRWSAPAGAAPE